MNGSLFEVEVLNGSLNSSDELTGDISIKSTLSGNLTTPGVIGITDYNKSTNKPKIEEVVLVGNKTLDEFGVSPISVDDILNILT